jgi:hypothetical protein
VLECTRLPELDPLSRKRCSRTCGGSSLSRLSGISRHRALAGIVRGSFGAAGTRAVSRPRGNFFAEDGARKTGPGIPTATASARVVSGRLTAEVGMRGDAPRAPLLEATENRVDEHRPRRDRRLLVRGVCPRARANGAPIRLPRRTKGRHRYVAYAWPNGRAPASSDHTSSTNTNAFCRSVERESYRANHAPHCDDALGGPAQKIGARGWKKPRKDLPGS